MALDPQPSIRNATIPVVSSFAPPRVSEEDYLAQAETMERMELLDGELWVPPAPPRIHQHVIGQLYRMLSGWADARSEPLFVGLAPLDVRIGPSRIVQPDVFVVVGPVDMRTPGPLDQIPSLCVEVMSTHRVYDRVTKRYLYAEAGVIEYWLVDPTTQAVEILHGPRLSGRRTFESSFPEGLALGLAERLGLARRS